MKDVDGGWAWVVLAASFAAYFISCGLFYNIGIFFVSFLDAFNESRGYTAWVGGLLASMFHVAGPLSSLILPHVGARGILLLGGCLMGFSYAILYFSQSIIYITAFYGLFGGIGSFFVISGCLTAVSDYFRRRLYLAAGLMSAGGGLGTVALGVLSEALIDGYGWRGALLILGGVALQVCVCASLVFKQPRHRRQKDGVSTLTDGSPEGRYSFLWDARFWWLSAGATTMNFAGFSLYVFLKDVALSRGLAFDYRAFVTCLGLGSAAGRAIAGQLATRVNPLLLYCGIGVVCAADILLMTVAARPWAFYALGGLFGFLHGKFCVLQSIQIAHVYGPRRMSVVWGFAMALGSIGVLAGPPVGGFIADQTGSYDGTLALYAAMMLVSGMCSLATYFLHRGHLARMKTLKLGNGETAKSMLPLSGDTNNCPEAETDQCPAQSNGETKENKV